MSMRSTWSNMRFWVSATKRLPIRASVDLLQIGGETLHGEDRQDGGRYPGQRRRVAVDEDLVDHVAHHPGAERRGAGEDEHEDEGHRVARR